MAVVLCVGGGARARGPRLVARGEHECARNHRRYYIADAKVTLNFLTFPLAVIRRLKPVEVSAVFDADVNAGIEGTLYRLRIPAGQCFVQKNTLCGRRRYAVDGDLRDGTHAEGGILLRR